VNPLVCRELDRFAETSAPNVNRAEAICLQSGTAEDCTAAVAAHFLFADNLVKWLRERCHRQQIVPGICQQIEHHAATAGPAVAVIGVQCARELATLAPTPGKRIAGSPEVSGIIAVEYVEPRTPLYRKIFEATSQQDFLSIYASGVNGMLESAGQITLALEECGVANAYYNPADKRISPCYELFHILLSQYAAGPDPKVLVALTSFVSMHEIGHALVDVLGLPVTGREEDAVDQFAVLTLFDDNEGSDLVIAASTFFANSLNQPVFGQLKFADEHSLEP